MTILSCSKFTDDKWKIIELPLTERFLIVVDNPDDTAADIVSSGCLPEPMSPHPDPRVPGVVSRISLKRHRNSNVIFEAAVQYSDPATLATPVEEAPKPIWLFAGIDHYASGGMQNFIGRYATVEEAKSALESLVITTCDETEWFQIVDTLECRVLLHSGGGYGTQFERDGRTVKWPAGVTATAAKADIT